MITGSYEDFKKESFKITGIDLNAYKERQMKRRIETLIDKKEIKSYSEYVLLLRRDKEALMEFLNYITINVSEFYRNVEQWKTLEKDVFPFLIKKFGKNIKIWSAACSTGDEPYSLVMLLSKFVPLQQIKIIATDIDNKIIAKAKEGVYNKKSLVGLPSEFLNKYFDQIDDRTYKIKSEIKSRVEFRNHNLLKDQYISGCHMIVCRNVMIYFTDEAKNDIYQKFNNSLVKEGILFVGSTEQMMQCERFGYKQYGSFFYQKI